MKKLLCISLGLLSTNLYAGTAVNATVTGFTPYSTGTAQIILFKTNSLSGTPACNTTQRFAMNSTNPRFTNTVSAIMAAYAAGKPVQVKGLNTCAVWGNSEDVEHICVGDIPC